MKMYSDNGFRFKWFTKVGLAVSLIGLALQGCGSRLQDDPLAPSRKGFTRNVTGDVSGGGSGRCKLMTEDPELKAKGFEIVDVNVLKLKTADQYSKSLCDLLFDYDSYVALIQFSGVLCLSCQEEAKLFSQELKIAGPFSNKIAHVVALTDFISDYTEADFKDFMSRYAPHSIRTHDPEANLWRHFSQNPDMPTRPTVIAFNRSGLGYVVNSEGADPQKILLAARFLADSNSAAPNAKNTPPGGSSPPNPIVPGPSPEKPAPVNPGPVIPAPGVGGKSIALSSAQNIALADAAGNSSTLTQYFENADYLVIDLSQYNCTYCKQLASKYQGDSAFQLSMNGTKCKALTVVPTRDLAAWVQSYPVATFMGKTSRGVASLQNIAAAFGVNFGGTPTAFVIDRQGRMVDQQIGATPAKVSSLCK